LIGPRLALICKCEYFFASTEHSDCTVRTFDKSDTCTTFEVCLEGRTLTFQAETVEDMRTWIRMIEAIHDRAMQNEEEVRKRKILEKTPYRVRLFDERGIDVFIEMIKFDIHGMYPPSQTQHVGAPVTPKRPPVRARLSVIDRMGQFDNDEESDGDASEEDDNRRSASPPTEDADVDDGSELATLAEHVECASSVLKYLEIFIPELRKTDILPARNDVLAVTLVEINEYLGQRLVPIANQSRELASMAELLSFVTLITRYQATLKKCYFVVIAPDAPAYRYIAGRNVLTCSLFDYLPDVCNRYVNGDGLGEKGEIGPARKI
jgi:hypothetical protein